MVPKMYIQKQNKNVRHLKNKFRKELDYKKQGKCVRKNIVVQKQKTTRIECKAKKNTLIST